MSYLVTTDVQPWLNQTKFNVTSVDPTHEQTAVNTVFGKISQRYDTSTWIDSATTPTLILNLLSMWVASVYLRRAASEEDGLTTYADWLEMRADAICDKIVEGAIDIPGVEEDPLTSLGGSSVFFPTDAATQIWEDSHEFDGSSFAEGAAPRAFTMDQRF